MSKLGVGIVGAGSVALRGVLPHLTREDLRDRLEVTAICDPVYERAVAAKDKFSVESAYATIEELLACPAVDMISICSPIGVHFDQGKMAIEAGKHVHFNKTMTTTAREADELIELAKRRGVKIVASPGEMLRPHNRYIRKLIAQKAIGELCWATCGAAFGDYHDNEGPRQGADILSNIDPTWYYKNPGGGPLFDMTVYCLHGLTGILGPIKRVTAMSGTQVREREWQGRKVQCEAHDTTLIVLETHAGPYAFVYGTPYGSITEHFTGSYFGTRGSIIGNKLNGEYLRYPGYEKALRSATWIDGNQLLLPHVVGEHRNIDEHHVFEDIMQLVDWIREDKPTLATAEHARHVIEVIESAYLAASTGQTIDLATTFDHEAADRFEQIEISSLKKSTSRPAVVESKINVAIIGAGLFARQCHAPGLSTHPGARISAVASGTQESAKFLASAFDIDTITTDYRELLSRKDIDAVCIAAPDHLHCRIALDAIKAGKHVLCEKPLAMTVPEAIEMAEAARASGLINMVAFTFRYSQSLQKLRELIRDGFIGRPIQATLQVYWGDLLKPDRLTWREDQELSAAGILADAGTHLFDALAFVLGRVSRVSASTLTAKRDRDCMQPTSIDRFTCTGLIPRSSNDLPGAAIGLEDNHIQALLLADRLSRPLHPVHDFAVTGTEGTLGIFLTRGENERIDFLKAGAQRWTSLPLPEERPSDEPVALERMMHSFVDAIHRGASNKDLDPDFEDGLYAQLAIETARQSALEGRWKEIEMPSRQTVSV